MRAIASALPGPRTVQPPDWRARAYSVLYVRYERIGDMIMSTSMIRALASAQSTIALDVLGTQVNAPVLQGNPYVSRVVTLGKGRGAFAGLLKELRQRRYDVVVDGRVNKPAAFVSTPLVMWAAGARYRIGAGGGAGDLIYNIRVRPFDRNDMGTHYMDASAYLAEPFGVDVANFDWRPELFLTAAECSEAEAAWQGIRATDHGAHAVGRQKRLLLNLSASEPKRRWPDERFIEVMRPVLSRYPSLRVGVMALPSEWSSAQAVASALGAVTIGTPTIRTAFAAIGAADVVFTPDTSISHAAAALRKPAVVLLKRDHAQYAPYRLAGSIVYWDGDTIEALPVAPVVDAVSELVENFAVTRSP